MNKTTHFWRICYDIIDHTAMQWGFNVFLLQMSPVEVMVLGE